MYNSHTRDIDYTNYHTQNVPSVLISTTKLLQFTTIMLKIATNTIVTVVNESVVRAFLSNFRYTYSTNNNKTMTK